MSQDQMFWADQVAQDLIASKQEFVVSTGITPSGHIHIGNMREVVTADAVVRALKERGKKVTFYYIADTFDPLRKVYPFLSEKKYTPFVGMPLSEIPSPDDSEPSYADFFLKPFLRSLGELDIQVEVLRADQMYKEGRYVENIIKALSKTKEIRSILKELTGKETEADWSPFVPICNKTKKMTGNKVLGFDQNKKTVQYVNDEGYESEVPMAGGGKLTWRLDWPARWQILNVTFEPFGKDHASRGGSYDTAKRFVKEIFDFDIPHPAEYEWISLIGGGDMSSSKGNVISIAQMVEVMPAEVLKYSVIRVKPTKRITFDPGLPMLTLIDEFDDPTVKTRNQRAVELSSISKNPPLGIPFKHIVSLYQTTQGNLDEMEKILVRAGYEKPSREVLRNRIAYAQKWLEAFAPEEMKFEIQQTLPTMVSELSPTQKKGLGELSNKLQENMDASQVHEVLYDVKNTQGLAPQEIFEAVYVSILGKKKGPRAGFFLASLDHDFVVSRFKEASQAS
ncbi:MAG: lysine--tRNA ligase [Bdellovibrionales bacterium]|nr:lysine--tRNA ligase [Bdellovibrionales bacterium]